jgi:hypothetical protein
LRLAAVPRVAAGSERERLVRAVLTRPLEPALRSTRLTTGLTCLVEVETMANRDVEEVVDREALQDVRFEVVARAEVLLAGANAV